MTLCEKAGFSGVRTYIQSGNVVFDSSATEAKVKATLENALATKLDRVLAAMANARAPS